MKPAKNAGKRLFFRLRQKDRGESNYWLSLAVNGYCALKTEDLYVVHLLKARGIVNMDDFWQDLFESDGVLEMKKYLEMLAPK